MHPVLSSASKLVLLFLVLVLGVLTLIAGIHDVVTGHFGEVTKIVLGAFGSALTFVLGFYFGHKGDAALAAVGK